MTRAYEYSGTLVLDNNDQEVVDKAQQILSLDDYELDDNGSSVCHLRWWSEYITLAGGQGCQEAHDEMAVDLGKLLGKESMEGLFETKWWSKEREPDLVCGDVEVDDAQQ